MSFFTVPRKRFNWQGFVGTVSRFALSRGADEAFPIAEDGVVVFRPDHDELSLPGGMAIENIPTDPAERLEAGFDLFAPFAAIHDFGELVCADGGTIIVPDLDEVDDEFEDDERPPLSNAQRRLIEKTECDERCSYGFQISLKGTSLTFKTVLVSESDGNCEIEDVNEAGLLDAPMADFINSFVVTGGKDRSAKKRHALPATSEDGGTLAIRYMGADHARRFLIQRGDGKFWTGGNWSRILDNAQVFSSHRAAGVACNALHRKKWGGKPCRTFKVTVEVTLVADAVARIDQKTLAQFLADAVRIDVDSSVHGEGPVNGSFVTARMNLSTLEETCRPKNVF